jgi:hypothetical protein
MIYGGIAIGIVAISVGMFYATNAQQASIPDTAVASAANLEGSVVSSDSGLAPVINKERWHEDPFGDLSAQIRAKAGQ